MLQVIKSPRETGSFSKERLPVFSFLKSVLILLLKSSQLPSKIVLVGLFALLVFTAMSPFAFPESSTEKRNGNVRNVGGILFDVDEGVDIEQGPGGSVYVRSNREYMQARFKAIDDKLVALESRLDKIEKEKASIVQVEDQQMKSKQLQSKESKSKVFTS